MSEPPPLPDEQEAGMRSLGAGPASVTAVQRWSDEPLMLTAADAARFLGITLSTLRRETRRGKLRAKRIGTRYWYNRSMLAHYAAEMDGVDGEHPGPQVEER
jgi:excisionase family DNA binding protein